MVNRSQGEFFVRRFHCGFFQPPDEGPEALNAWPESKKLNERKLLNFAEGYERRLARLNEMEN